MTSQRKIVVVGGVAAGASAATKARRTDEAAEIIILERGPYVSFANCGLPYYVGGDIPRLDDLLVMTPRRFSERFRIQVRLCHEAVRIDRAAHQVSVRNLESGETYNETYDKLILATGAKPILPSVPGHQLPGIFTLTTINDAVAIREWSQAGGVKQATVIGAGFIGLEAVEALLRLGLEVHLVEKLPQVLPYLDPEMANPLEAHLVAKGVTVHLGSEVVAFQGSGKLAGVRLHSGETIAAQLAIVAIGVRPDVALAREAGLKLGPSGNVEVDDHMRTSDPDVYACGDIAEVTSRITGRKTRVPLAGPANKQGRIAGANAAGSDMTFPGIIGTSIVKVCDLTAAKTGLSEREAQEEGYDPFVSFIHPPDHATYYPGSQPMAFKLIADRASGRVLGAQIVGPQGVDKRIDVVATAIYAGMTVEDLEGLDLAYAPPYSSAKDPVIMAGFVAANQYRGELQVTTAARVAKRMDAGEKVRLLDVRTPAEYAAGHIPGAKLIPLDSLRDRLSEIDRDGIITVYCGVGYRSYHACKILTHAGHQVENLSGGFTSWAQAYPERIERTQEGI